MSEIKDIGEIVDGIEGSFRSTMKFNTLYLVTGVVGFGYSIYYSDIPAAVGFGLLAIKAFTERSFIVNTLRIYNKMMTIASHALSDAVGLYLTLVDERAGVPIDTDKQNLVKDYRALLATYQKMVGTNPWDHMINLKKGRTDTDTVH
jgi:hypothetical protein